MPGFQIDEVMVGTHRLAGTPAELPMHLRLTWGHPRLKDYLNPCHPDFLRAQARGSISAARLVHKADCTGTLQLLYFSGRRIRYELDFADPRGRRYHYSGSKADLRPWNLHRTHTTCCGTITEKDAGQAVSHSAIRFPLSTLGTFLCSFRLVPADDRRRRSFPGSTALPDGCAPTLTPRERRIMAALAGGLIPAGGSFDPGAEQLAGRWLPRTESALQRMPRPTRFFFKAVLHLFNHMLPWFFIRRLGPLVKLAPGARTRLFSRLEKSGFPGHLAVMLIKALILPAFYGLPEVKTAIGYAERFANPAFEHLKA